MKRLVQGGFKVKNQAALVFEAAGAVFIILLGSALHFTYALSGSNPLVGFFSAVNESVWEHLKLAFWPAFGWMLLEVRPLKRLTNNFFTAKAVGAYLMVAFIPAVFYSYTVYVGESILSVDIATFVAAVFVGQFVSYQLFTRRSLPATAEKASVIALFLLAAAFIVFTFYTPALQVFRDPVTGRYGV